MPGRSMNVPPVLAVSPPVGTWPEPEAPRPLPLDGVVVAVPPPPTVGEGSVVAVLAAVVGAVVACAPPTGGWVRGGLVVVAAREVVGVVPLREVVGGVVGAVEGAAVPAVVDSLSPFRTTKVARPAPRTPTIRTASAMPRSRLRFAPSGSEDGPYPPIDYAASATSHWGPYFAPAPGSGRVTGSRRRLTFPHAGVAQWQSSSLPS